MMVIGGSAAGVVGQTCFGVTWLWDYRPGSESEYPLHGASGVTSGVMYGVTSGVTTGVMYGVTSGVTSGVKSSWKHDGVRRVGSVFLPCQ